MRKVAERFPRISRRIYLDHLSLQWKGRKVQKKKVKGKWVMAAPKEFVEAVHLLVELLIGVLKARVSAKSRFVANSEGLLKSSLAALEERGLKGKGSGAKVVRYLGIDASASVQVTGWRATRKARHQKAKKMKRRGIQTRKAGAQIQGVWMAGPVCSMGFGAEVYGVNGAVLEAARKTSGAVVLLGEAGGAQPEGF